MGSTHPDTILFSFGTNEATVEMTVSALVAIISLHPLPVSRYGGERKKRDAMRPPRYRNSFASDESRLDGFAHKQGKATERRWALRLQYGKI